MADLHFSGIDGAEPDGNLLRQTTEISWYGSIKARLGYAAGRWMPYATLGIGFADIRYGQSCPAGAASGTCASTGAYDAGESKFGSGLSAGIGVKYALNDQMLLGLDYSYADYGDDIFSFSTPSSIVPNTGSYETTLHVVKVTLDWRF